MSILSYPADTTKPQSGLGLIYALVTGRLIPGGMWQKTAYRLKFLARTLAFPRATLTLMNHIAAHPLRNEILAAQPTLPCKVQRPYLAVNMPRGAYTRGLCDHYAFIAQRLPAAVRHGHLGKEPCKLAVMIGKDESTYSISMNATQRLDKEGEITLMFNNAAGQALANVTFIIMNYQGQRTLFIGALQGPAHQVEHQLIQQATKSCHGLFPKRILMEALLLLAEKLNIDQVLAVGNKTHIYEHPRYNKRKHLVYADYDSFWLTLGAQQNAQGYFRFPAQMAHKSLEEIASKKRAEYRRRYQLLDAMEAQIRQRFYPH